MNPLLNCIRVLSNVLIVLSIVIAQSAFADFSHDVALPKQALSVPKDGAATRNNQVCVSPTIAVTGATWEDGGTSPWSAANPDILINGNLNEEWHFYADPPRRIEFSLNGLWNIDEVRYSDSWGNGSLILDTDGIGNGNEVTVSTDHYPLGWYTADFTANNVNTVWMHTSSSNLKIRELEFCGTPANPTVDDQPPSEVTSVSFNSSCNSVTVTWPESTDTDGLGNPSGPASSYRISINGGPPEIVTSLSHSFTTIEQTSYTVTLWSVDAAGNQSLPNDHFVTTPQCPITGDCIEIAGVTADWPAGTVVPPLWKAPSPDVLLDDDLSTHWYYYWSQDGFPTPLVFTLPTGSSVEAIRWHDFHGVGSLFFSANGQTTEIDTDQWPLEWRTHDWNIGATTQVTMTSSSDEPKISELRFCGGIGNSDTVPPDPVDDLVAVGACTTASASWSAPDDFDDNGLNGVASSYRVWANTNAPQTVFDTQATVSGLTPNANNTIYIIAVDAAGNQSTTASFNVTTTACSGVQDQDLDTVHIIDSFGHLTVPNTNGHQWHGINDYYNSFYADGTHDWYEDDMCSKDIHNSYWVLADENGQPMGSQDYDNDGDFESFYPTWHPPIHDEGGADECWFMHEHGEDPRESPLYDLDDPISIGVPFGYVHSKMGNNNGRLEDHVGHKVIVEPQYTPVTGNPYGPGHTLNEQGFNCTWLSKIHQGTHSTDALGNNLHEYFLNIDCDDAASTHVRIKELSTWGEPSSVYSENCTQDWEWVGYEASGPIHVPGTNGHPAQDGKREFGCYDVRHDVNYSHGVYKDTPKLLGELWKPDGVVKAPNNGGVAIFSPYYVTLNSTRYVDPDWQDRFDTTIHTTYLGFSCTQGDSDGNSSNDCQTNAQCMNMNSGRRDGCTGTGGMVSSVDLCVRDSDAWNLSVLAMPGNVDYSNTANYPGFCYLLDTQIRNEWEQEIDAANGDTLALSESRRLDPRNPFDGTMRGVHSKDVQIYREADPAANYMGRRLFCTDAFAENPQWADVTNPNNPTCPPGTIMQIISTDNNSWGSIAGSSINATRSDGTEQSQSDNNEQGLIGGGEGSEFVIDDVTDPANKVRPPN